MVDGRRAIAQTRYMELPRGIAVVDAGFTNTKILLFSAAGELIAQRTAASAHVEGPPYRHTDPDPMVQMMRAALPELDRILPIDAVVPCAHGAALACLASDGSLAMPVMDYTAEPPEEIVADYKKIMPSFAESGCPLLPMALTHGLQLYWQQRVFPEEFASITNVMPWIQYVAFRLAGRAVIEITGMSCQSHLVDVMHGGLSSLVCKQGWKSLFPPMVKAWETIGDLKPEFRGGNFRGVGRVLAGIHDSSANYLRYLAGGLDRFTLVSTGTWSICLDNTTAIGALREELDTVSNTDIFGRTVATSRFFGGKEFEILAGPAPVAGRSLDHVTSFVERNIMALPSFTWSSGPMPGSGNRGRILGECQDAERASLASLYCALMVSEQLDAIGARHRVIVDGPFASNPVFLAVLAQLRGGQKLFASELRHGTAAGAACLALMAGERLPRIELQLAPVAAPGIEGLEHYQGLWKKSARVGTAVRLDGV
ncbi:MAG TPA: FGGY family carbohydrate kinase [Aestuariivirga sp.]|nr:FGGY family carbohydrate kinase [Aestuariivirga sp.]